MKLIVQRVKEAKVEVEGRIVGEIDHGYLLYACIEIGDNDSTVIKACEKVSKLRIFEDETQKMNLDIKSVKGSILSVSQFTLSWNGKKGHRPSFDLSMSGDKAKQMFESFNSHLRMKGLKVASGVFASDMQVHSINDGPVTFILNFT